MSAKLKKETLFPFLIYDKPIKYTDNIVLYPVTMNDIISFQILSQSITVRKNSIFREKQIIKMTYLDFLFYCLGNKELEIEYKIADLSIYYLYAVQLLQLCCKNSEIKLSQQNQIVINGEIITPSMFDDLRRIIIIQNDIDFDIDEFVNHDTEQRLLKAQKDSIRDKNNVNIEDYIDSLVIALNITVDKVMNMTIRKFWRYIKRYQLRESYTILKTGECSGMVKFKEPIEYWIKSLDEDDKFKNLKMDEESLKNKINSANN